MIITSIVFAKILLEKKKINLNFKSIVVIITSIILYSIVIGTLDGVSKTLLLCGVYLFLFKIIFNKNYYESTLLMLVYTLISVIADLIVLFFIVVLLNTSTSYFYNNLKSTIVMTLIVNLLILLVTFLLRKVLKKILKLKINNDNVIIIYIVLTLICIIILFYKACNNLMWDKDSILSICIMVCFIAILLSLINQRIKNNKLMIRYLKLLEFIKNYEKELDKQKSLRHESKNQLITARSKIVDKKKEHEVIEYLNSIISDYVKGNNEKYTSFQYLPANGIKGFFYYKANEAENNGINLSINVSPKVENTFIGDLDTNDFKQLGILLGVYLDNAIEASKNSKDKKMAIEIYKTGEDIEIIISNTYEGKIDTESIGKTKYTTKGKNHGYGLMLVSKILEENKRFEAKRVVTDVVYSQKLKIKKPI